FAGAFLFLMVFINASEILSFLPEKYHEGKDVIKLIAFGAFVNNAMGLNFGFLQYSDKYIVNSILFIVLGLLSTLSNMFLIPVFGIMGAAMGTALSMIIMNVAVFVYIKR